jgi:integrase
MAIGQFSVGQADAPGGGEMPLFGAYAEHYMKTHAMVMLKRNTHMGYRTIIDKHLSVWANRPMNQIKRRDVKELLLHKQQQGLAPGTVENIKALASGIFTFAYEEEILTANPALKLGKFIRKSDSRKHAVFASKEQVAAMLTAAQEHFPEHHAFILTAFRTGMRLGELLGMAFEDINFDASTVEVCRAYSHGYFSTPKSHKTRKIEISDQLKMALRVHEQKMKQRFGGALPECEVPTGLKGGTTVHLVFPNERGGPMDGDNFRHRVFSSLIEKANVPRMRFHDCRHTYASLLLQSGAPVHYVKEQMGHASISTTVDTYGHVMPNANRNAVNKLDDFGPTPAEWKPAIAS